MANFGSYWLKPPGVPKTLHQMREEKREHDEHQEAVRREQAAQDLAEAEAAGLPDDNMMDDVQLDGAQDLDDEIPDAAEAFSPTDDDDTSEEEIDNDDDDDDDNQDDEEVDAAMMREERQNYLMTARMLMPDDAFGQSLILGAPDGDGMYGGEEELEEQLQGHMLGEDDFVQSTSGLLGDEFNNLDDMMGDMDADLDDDIPEAEEDGGYEHTDSEAELSTSDSDASGGRLGYADHEPDPDDHIGHSMDYGPRASQVMGPPQSPTLRGREDASATRQSLELSSILSQDDTSFMDSSPAQGRRARQL